MKSFAIPLCCLLAGCGGKLPTLADIGLASAPKAKPVAGYVIDRPKPVMTDLPGRASPLPPSVTAYQPSLPGSGPSAAPVALMAATVPPPAPVETVPIITPPSQPSSEPPAAVPPAAAPLAVTVPPDAGQGMGLPEPSPPVTRTLPLGEALRLLASKAGVNADLQIAGNPTVEVTGDPSGDLAADLNALMGSARPAHYAAIGTDRKGTPIRLLVSPYPIVGAGQ